MQFVSLDLFAYSNKTYLAISKKRYHPPAYCCLGVESTKDEKMSSTCFQKSVTTLRPTVVFGQNRQKTRKCHRHAFSKKHYHPLANWCLGVESKKDENMWREHVINMFSKKHYHPPANCCLGVESKKDEKMSSTCFQKSITTLRLTVALGWNLKKTRTCDEKMSSTCFQKALPPSG